MADPCPGGCRLFTVAAVSRRWGERTVDVGLRSSDASPGPPTDWVTVRKWDWPEGKPWPPTPGMTVRVVPARVVG